MRRIQVSRLHLTISGVRNSRDKDVQQTQGSWSPCCEPHFFSGGGSFKQHIHHTPKRVHAVFRLRFLKDIFAGNNFTGTHYLNADKKLMRFLTNLYHQTLRGNPEYLWKDGDSLSFQTSPIKKLDVFFLGRLQFSRQLCILFLQELNGKLAKSVAEGTAKQPLAMFFFEKILEIHLISFNQFIPSETFLDLQIEH